MKKKNKTTRKAKKVTAKKKSVVAKRKVQKTTKKSTLTKKENKPDSQYDMVFNHLVKHGSINTMEAIKSYGILRLGAVIFNLRQGGLSITTGTHLFTNNTNGRKSLIAKYVLK